MESAFPKGQAPLPAWDWAHLFAAPPGRNFGYVRGGFPGWPF